MVWLKALDLSQLQHDERHAKVIEGQKILFIWHDNNVYAIQSQCPHFKLPLIKGKINNEGAIVCPFHKSAFDLKTGHVNCWSTWPPAIGSLLGKVSKPKDLKVYETQIIDDVIHVKLS